MKNYVSESRAQYEDMYHGLFSNKLAEWAIGNMKTKDNTGRMVRLTPTLLSEVMEKIKASGTQLDSKYKYTAWYLYNMARADYPKTLVNDNQRILFIIETLLDPDCCPEAVLECFTAKMCIMGMPINWEEYL